ncbi:TonB-dependent receptor [Elizabethkingia argentiflava]|uniref:TonB-dependent receptor n=1 Tax=Elizabethkingia argenteiflava TaxID=2681556 RepID=A0A845PTW8_9FLAO|nr:carboxypeptidase regulatory-like domain-containing protein [Elizabethkingia argenteiflava]NAW51264.1 TonB-dependent receptor [Elizabethkingia argenteiflava]
MKSIQAALLCILLSFFGGYMLAQTTQASILGRVVDRSDLPQSRLKVKIINESTGFTSETLTNVQGEYVFREIPLGGPYTIIVDGRQKKEGYYVNFGDQLSVNLKLADVYEKNIQEVVVKGNYKNTRANLGASTAITARNISVLPVNGRSFTSLTELSPLSGKNGSLSGQLESSTNFTIDGMTAKNPTSAGSTTSRSGAPYSISIESVREFKITTNQYDVTLGRSGGGTVSAVTKSGTNTFSGSVFEYQRAGWLSSGFDIKGNRRTNDFSTYQFGFSLGGPIIRNKLHFFLTWDHQLDNRPLMVADIQTQEDELRLNVTKETLNKVLQIGRDKYGVGATPQFGSFGKIRNSDAAFLRLDWQMNTNNLLTIRNNFTYDLNKNALEDNSRINFYESYASDKNWDNSLLLTLRSNLKESLTNEFKFQHLYTFQNTFQNDQLKHAVPRMIIDNLTSKVGAIDLSTNIQLGGHRFGQESFKNNVLQLVDNLYYNTDKIKYTYGIEVMYTRAQSVYGSEVNGRYHFSSLTDFENMRPYRFYREVPLLEDTSVNSDIWNLGGYGQLITTIGTGLQLTAGLRFDYGAYPKAPLNKNLYQQMEIRTDYKIKSFVIQPRFQLDWDVQQRHKDLFKFGGGIFSSDINNYMLINNLYFDGKRSATVDIDPQALGLVTDFESYRKNYVTTPTLPQYQLPTINYTGQNAKIPVIYKSHIAYTHFFTPKLRAGLAAYAAWGRNNYFYYDRNMQSKPYFTISSEGDRGVFVPVDKINIENATSNWKDGRINKNFGRVLELVSDGKVNQYSIVLDASYKYAKDGELNASYTWSDIKDNTSYSGNVANTATLYTPVSSDPRDLRMRYSDNQFRHKLVLYGNAPTFHGFTLGIRYAGMGGTRFSLMAGGNINGDFVDGNDLAYIYPNLTAPLLGDAQVGKALKDYIRHYNGRIAHRNGGKNGFYGVWDIRIAKKLKLDQKDALELSLDIFNFANLLNKNWGVNRSYENLNLYKIKGFDPTGRYFTYTLNTAGLPPLSGDPYQIQLGMRYSF